MSEDRYVTHDEWRANCELRHNTVDKSQDVLFDKVDKLVAQVYEIAKELKSFGNRFYLVVIVSLLGIIGSLIFQDRQPIEIRILQDRDGALKTSEE